MWSVSYVTCVDIIAQVSLLSMINVLFLDVLILKLGNIILPAGRPEIIPRTACTTKNYVALTLDLNLQPFGIIYALCFTLVTNDIGRLQIKICG